ncbi:MAG: hypothetical protein LBM19_03400 [Holosporales bacterium]|jgi:F0F1-type ATP synthase membrane subunit b/b'|nr:hypothetical protein [Holosporales bacterium]
MLPQLDSSFYTSQLFWLFVCLAILIAAFKKCFIPRINSIRLKRSSFIEKKNNDIKVLESSVLKLEEEIRALKELEIKRSSEIIKDAVKKSEIALNERSKIIKRENEKSIDETRSKFGSEIKNLELRFNSQIISATQKIYEKLFS